MELNPQCHTALSHLPDFCSMEDFAKVIGVSRATMYRMAQRGELPCLRIGKRIILSRERLERWIDQAMEVK